MSSPRPIQGRALDLPFFPIWVKDFLGDNRVAAMTTEEVGAYFLLLLNAWQEEPPATLPNDDVLLARMARMDAGRWMGCRNLVLPCFGQTRDGRRLVQKRLKAVYDEAVQKSSKRSDAGKKGAIARWQPHGNAIDLPMAKTCDSGYGSDSSSEGENKSASEVTCTTVVARYVSLHPHWARSPSALGSVAARLSQGLAAEVLIQAAEAYRAHCDRKDIPPKSRQSCTTFYAAGGAFEQFAAVTKAPTETPEARQSRILAKRALAAEQKQATAAAVKTRKEATIG